MSCSFCDGELKRDGYNMNIVGRASDLSLRTFSPVCVASAVRNTLPLTS